MLGIAGVAQTAIADVPGAAGAPVVINIDRWGLALSEPKRFKRGLASQLQQTLAYVEAPPFEEISTESRWHQPWSEPIRLNQRTRLGTARQQTLAFIGFAPFPETVTEDRWHLPWSEPIRLNLRARLRPSAQHYFEFQPWPDIRLAWMPPWSEPVRVKRRLTTGAQQVLAYIGAGPFAEPTTYDRWGYAWSEPVRFKPGLRATEQRPATVSPLIGNPFSFGCVIQ